MDIKLVFDWFFFMINKFFCGEFLVWCEVVLEIKYFEIKGFKFGRWILKYEKLIIKMVKKLMLVKKWKLNDCMFELRIW